MTNQENQPLQLPSEYGRKKIAELKERHPSKAAWIDERVRQYVLDDSTPPGDDEFVHLLRNVLEPGSGAGGQHAVRRRRRGGGDRRSRR